ncbi:hypothetical protein AMATHDRAFT_194786 [Amanita thiersii Skay4041]|uniref:YDG domain-containing protein n=1 Tax=Amanita thiersii Skay4041 TaxID=703135 RepID=A0A2A9NMK2_9AGAR|nr:hypothetical protein AMATHDRAFT_194786 [Amanita thiersii Skay4041]
MPLEDIRRLLMEKSGWFANIEQERDPKFGPIAGAPIGTKWASRQDLQRSGVHTANFAGISGSASEGAYSIVVSGGYVDDVDNGDTLVYTGTGMGCPCYMRGGGKQVKDQSFNHKDNRALQRSCETGRPVRVIRGSNLPSIYAPESGKVCLDSMCISYISNFLTRYRYDGLYKVDRAYEEKGRHGFKVCRYHLSRLPNQPALPVRSHLPSTSRRGI